MYNKVIYILLSSGNECILSYCKRHKKSKPGWNIFCEEPRQKSTFWHKIWCDSGSPRSGIVAELMRKSTARDHLSVKYFRKHEKQISAEKMAVGLLSKKGVDFWKEFKKQSPSNCKISSNIDDVVGGSAICNLFCKSTKCCMTVYHTDRMSWMKSRVRWMH